MFFKLINKKKKQPQNTPPPLQYTVHEILLQLFTAKFCNHALHVEQSNANIFISFELMLNINPLRTDIFCLPQRFSTFYQVLNNCDEKLTLTSLLAWKHNKIRFCSFKCCQKIPLAIKVHLGIKSDGVRKSGFSDIR